MINKAGTLLLLLFFAVITYAFIVNRNSGHMTIRQMILKTFYPALMWVSGKKAKSLSGGQNKPIISFYTLKAVANNGAEIDFSGFRGKKVLLVNTASDCGYTKQYEELQQLHEKYPDQLIILGFPANDFKQQEKGSDEEIALFCKVNFGVSFPIMKKSVVVKNDNQNPVFTWLSHASQNGWCNQQPSWNFSKYLVNEEGVLEYYFDPAVSPMSEEVIAAIENS